MSNYFHNDSAEIDGTTVKFLTWDATNGKFVSNINNTDFVSAWQKLVSVHEAGYDYFNDDGGCYLFVNESIVMLLCGLDMV